MRKLLIPIGLVFLAATVVSAKKVFEIDEVLNKLEVQPSGIAQPDTTWERIKANIKVLIFNGSIHDLNINSLGLITIETLYVYSRTGQQIATAAVNQSKVSIPSKGAWETDWIEVRIPLNSALEMLTGAIGFDYTKYQYKLAIDVAGFGKYMIG